MGVQSFEKANDKVAPDGQAQGLTFGRFSAFERNLSREEADKLLQEADAEKLMIGEPIGMQDYISALENVAQACMTSSSDLFAEIKRKNEEQGILINTTEDELRAGRVGIYHREAIHHEPMADNVEVSLEGLIEGAIAEIEGEIEHDIEIGDLSEAGGLAPKLQHLKQLLVQLASGHSHVHEHEYQDLVAGF
tara:strand:+ start:345 stop:920 length:576 start_codon:yes stop_codon:yes gene_type:complete